MKRYVPIVVLTRLGERYEFPAMDLVEMDKVLVHLGSGQATQLLLVNASGCTLTLPIRIIEKILVAGEQKWPSSA